MINFRFHLVSLIAVFLALGLGILVGSSVVDQVIVDRLHREITSVRNESNARRAQNKQLNDELSRLQDSVNGSAPYAVQQRLQDVPVVVIADKGLSSSALKQTLGMLQQAGARAPGVLWLDDSFRLDDPKQVQSLQQALGLTSGTATATRAKAMQALASRFADPSGRPDRTTTTSAAAATISTATIDPVTALERAHFLSLTNTTSVPIATFPSSASRALIVTGTDSKLLGTDTLVQLVHALGAAHVPTVVAEVYDDHHSDSNTGRGAAVAPVRSDSALAKSVSTVDDGDLVQGQVAEVLALEQLAAGTVGHYGYGKGASGAYPKVGS